ncbi:alanine dehydrogenase [Methylohalomonas lacus]|uniref:Alanine dehydrogenase n=1 Tax=Methylohalomonas lacus TaxID=398773 RepID=A0AAE3HIQ7_9GAMM|nr:alanine dehydrogenase [Methylohalomonas lacus]MCS3903094.1 alanine dehydrogenase [Methylohalomonas lacus]
MQIGLVRETKDQERRVALTPSGVAELATAGHGIRVETGAGDAIGFSDVDYQQAGAQIVDTAAAWDNELVVKVKEPLANEYEYFDGQILFAFLHLAGSPVTLTKALIKGKVSAIAYELVGDDNGYYPLLAPMSAIAGNMATTVGAHYLARTNGGKGVQLGRLLEQRHGRVLVIGNGVVGCHAARTADALGARVWLFGRDGEKFAQQREQFSPELTFVESTDASIREHIADADLVIGAVLQPADRAPYVVSRDMIASMQPGSVVVDVSIDQGGCIETARATCHSKPVYREADVIHYAVTNMPSAYPRTATQALTAASLPYVLQLANAGMAACRKNTMLAQAINTHRGLITNATIARALRLDPLYTPFSEIDA